jgi:hypothetical protein
VAEDGPRSRRQHRRRPSRSTRPTRTRRGGGKRRSGGRPPPSLRLSNKGRRRSSCRSTADGSSRNRCCAGFRFRFRCRRLPNRGGGARTDNPAAAGAKEPQRDETTQPAPRLRDAAAS